MRITSTCTRLPLFIILLCRFFFFALSENTEELVRIIDQWLTDNNYNQYGDPKDTWYTGGNPLFDESTSEYTDRITYLEEKFPNLPWLGSANSGNNSAESTEEDNTENTEEDNTESTEEDNTTETTEEDNTTETTEEDNTETTEEENTETTEENTESTEEESAENTEEESTENTEEESTENTEEENTDGNDEERASDSYTTLLSLASTWLQNNNLNEYGDPSGTMYMGGSPLFDMSTGQMTDRYTYLCEKFPNLPWLDNETTNEDTNNILDDTDNTDNTETDSNPNNETMSTYPDCEIDEQFLGDGWCDLAWNQIECGYDGGDCI